MADPNDTWLQDVLDNLARSEAMSANRALPMSADVAPSPTIPSVTPKPSSDVDWKTLIGLGVEGFASGFAGRAPQGPALLQRKQLAQQQQQQDAEKMQLDKLGMGLKVWEEIRKAAETIDDPKMAESMAQFLSGTMKTLGHNYSKEEISQAILNPERIDDILRRYPDLKRTGFNKKQILQYANDPLTRERVDKELDKVRGKEAFTALLQGKDKTQEIDGEQKKLSDLSWQQLLDLHPDVGRLSEEDKWQLNEAGYSKIKPKELIAAEKKGAIESTATRAADIRAEKSREAAAERQQKAIDATDRRFLENQEMQLKRIDKTEERIRVQEEQQRRLLPSQQKQLTGDRTAMKTIDDYKQAYENFVKESKGGTLSDIFRGTIAKNKTMQKVDDLVTAQGRTPAEIELAGKYNALIGNLRNLTNEVGVLTDMDAIRILGSFDPGQDRRQVIANINARRKSHERSYNTQLEDLQAIGKDVSRFTKEAPPSGPPVGTVQKGYRFKGGDPSKPESWEKVK